MENLERLSKKSLIQRLREVTEWLKTVDRNKTYVGYILAMQEEKEELERELAKRR